MEEYKLLKSQLKLLKLDAINESFAIKAVEYRNNKLDYINYLGELVKEQIERRIERSINYRFRESKFPYIKTYEQFVKDFPENFEYHKYEQLLDLSFIKNKENILFIGPPGVGKTHLAIAIGVRACQERIRTLFITMPDLIEQIQFARLNKYLNKYIEKLSANSLLIIDEIGYNPISTEDANIFFQLISKKYEKTSIILTSNKSFNLWGELFNDEVIAAAILDRLIHHSHIFKIKGDSYRIKEKILDIKNI
jgi:DNA replication protein DnaC